MYSKLKKLIVYILTKIYRAVRAPILWYQRKYNIQTKGVRVLMISQNKILLLKHWYNGLWVMPGGGVNRNEIPEYAAVREVKEEVGIEIKQLDYLLGTYSNTKGGKTDTVFCYVAELPHIAEHKKKFNFEISDMQWFDLSTLPNGVSKATLQRIEEYQNKDIQEQIRPWSY